MALEKFMKCNEEKIYIMTRQIIFGIFILVTIVAFFSTSCDKDSSTSPSASETITMTKISGDEQAGVPGDTLSVPLTVLINDKNGNVLSGKRVDFKILLGSACLIDSIVITNYMGKASTLLILGDQEGDVNVEAKVFGTDNCVVFNISANNLPPVSLTIVNGNNQSGYPENELPDTLQVVVKNKRELPTIGTIVTFSITEGSGTLSALSDTTNSLGIAQTTLTFGNSVGTTQVIASVNSLDPVIFTSFAAFRELTMVSIPAGSFQMGDIQGGGNSDELPVHTVTLDGFKMSATEITQGQYQLVMSTNPAYNYGVGDNYPVYYVSWYDAVKFCNALSDAAGLDRCYNESTWECDFSADGFRLPTEAEWEYACRAGTETKYYTGNSDSDLGRAGWYSSNSSSNTHRVGQKEPNAWGLYDMHGNIWEWCHDNYDNDYYSWSPSDDPTGRTSGGGRVYRGGSWGYNAGYCRSACRFRDDPSDAHDSIGFRVVRRPGGVTY